MHTNCSVSSAIGQQTNEPNSQFFSIGSTLSDSSFTHNASATSQEITARAISSITNSTSLSLTPLPTIAKNPPTGQWTYANWKFFHNSYKRAELKKVALSTYLAQTIKSKFLQMIEYETGAMPKALARWGGIICLAPVKLFRGPLKREGIELFPLSISIQKFIEDVEFYGHGITNLKQLEGRLIDQNPGNKEEIVEYFQAIRKSHRISDDGFRNEERPYSPYEVWCIYPDSPLYKDFVDHSLSCSISLVSKAISTTPLYAPHLASYQVQSSFSCEENLAEYQPIELYRSASALSSSLRRPGEFEIDYICTQTANDQSDLENDSATDETEIDSSAP